MAKCTQRYNSRTETGLTYCNATFDSFLCWPPTEAGTTAFQNCPVARLSDTSRLAFRRCGLDGLWLGRRKNESTLIGWTNYTPCFPAEVQNLFGKVYDEQSDPQEMFDIAQNIRYMEIFGFTMSLVVLLISLATFWYFSSLKNTRTTIHRNLFCAIILQLVIRLIMYFDQEIVRENSSSAKVPRGLDTVPYVCETCFIIMEYAITSMFCWMSIEGIYLHKIVTANALRGNVRFRVYLFFGWGAPVVSTTIWAVITSIHYSGASLQQCWYGYNFRPEYWICQGPRLAIIITNLIFLLNILRVLIGKLNQGEDSELMKARKAARAALILLPLLGITNILNMIEAPLRGPVWKFAVWCYTTHFLRSFQGVFIASIYCIFNSEVREVLCKVYTDWRDLREDMRRIRESSRNASRQRRLRRSSSILQPFRCFQGNVQGIEVDVEMDDEPMRRLYGNPRFLDTLPTIRFDDETQATTSF